MGLLEDVGAGPVAIDTPIFIYFIEQHPTYHPLVLPLFEAIETGRLAAVTSSLTLLETLVAPLRRDAFALARRYERILTGSGSVALVDIDLELLRSAAQIRAITGLKVPDAIQISTAIRRGCSAIVSNDGRWPRLPGLAVIRIDDYAALSG